MALLSLFKRRTTSTAGESIKIDSATQVRAKARQRLIGAVVLVAIGVVGFPLVFETQPRPLSVNTPIEMANKETTRVRRSGSEPITPVAPPLIEETPAQAGIETPEPPRPSASLPVVKPLLSQDKPADKKDPPKKPAPPQDSHRFALQVASYADTQSAQSMRQKIEKLHLKTYTQVLQTNEGSRTRVRVGPFSSRKDAEQALHQLKTAGVSASVVSLD